MGKAIGRSDIGYTEIKSDFPKKQGFDWNDNLIKGKEIIQKMNPEDLSKIIEFSQKKHTVSRNISMGGL